MGIGEAIYQWFQTAKGELLTAGFAGSAVSVAMEWTGVLPAIRKIVVGTLCALYLSPLALPLVEWVLGNLKVPRENAAGTSGFLMGVLGIVVIEILLKAFHIRRDQMGGGNED